MLGVAPIEIQIDVRIDDDTRQMVDELFAKRTEARKAQEEASRLTRSAVVALRGKGLTVRDVEAMTGVSPQRVSALQHA